MSAAIGAPDAERAVVKADPGGQTNPINNFNKTNNNSNQTNNYWWRSGRSM
jgi:hypothetical protein